jgi:hypothetical protein
VNEKRKLIFDFALECFFIVLFCSTMIAHFGFFIIVGVCMAYSISTRFFTKKPKPKKRERELATTEAIAWFAIGFSAICIFGFAVSKGLLNSIAFIIPMGIILLAIRLLYFSKELAALQTSKPASN